MMLAACTARAVRVVRSPMGSEEEEGRIEKLEQDAEREARSLAKDAEELGERIDERRRDWIRKREDSEPGAPNADESESEAEDGEPASEAT